MGPGWDVRRSKLRASRFEPMLIEVLVVSRLMLLALAACQLPPEVCALPSTGAGLPGDANGDGTFDLADPVLVHRHLFEGGMAPVCEDALVFEPSVPRSLFDGIDAGALFGWLFEGYDGPHPDPNCDDAVPLDDAACGRIGWTWAAPRRVRAATAEATLGIRNHSLEAGVDGWSVGVVAEGCAIDEVTVDDTVAAPFTGDGPGLVTEGYVLAEADGDVGITAVVLNWLHAQSLAPSADDYPVLRVRVSASTSGDCVPCTLTTTDGLATRGLPLDAVMVSAGRSYRPPTSSTTLSLCAP